MRPITVDRKNQIIKHLNDGLSARQVAQRFSMSHSTVNAIRNESKINVPKSKGGRVSKLTTRDKALCARMVLKDGLKTSVAVRSALQDITGIQVSDATVRRCLKKQGLEAIAKKKKPLLSAKNVRERLQWAKTHKDWTIDDWKRVIWSDETKINRFGSDGLHWAWKRETESLKPKHVTQTVKHGGGNIKIWGCITYDGVGFMTKIDTILDKDLYKGILEEELATTIEWYGFEIDKVIFQHDNDPKHTSKLVKEYLAEQDYEVMKWPAQSPDLNPIENIWSTLKRRLFSEYETHPNGMLDLWERVQDQWNKITMEECRKVIETMPKRCEDVIRAKGYWIDY